MDHFDRRLKPNARTRIVSAPFPLQISSFDENGDAKYEGSTVGSRAVPVPPCDSWLIEPSGILSDREWDAVLALMRDMHIPGLAAHGQATDALLERLSRLDHLVYLDLQASPGVTDVGVRHLTRLRRLRHLNLSCPEITDRGLEAVRELNQLSTFEMTHQQRVSDSGFKALERCDLLKRVNVMGTRAGDGMIASLSGKRGLGQLFVGNAVTDAGLSLLREFPAFETWRDWPVAMSLLSDRALPTQLWLDLGGSLTDAGIATVAGLDGLFALTLSGSDSRSGSAVTPAALRHVAELPNLGWLGCNGQLCTDDAMAAIAAMPRLRFLMCQDAVGGDVGFAALSDSSSVEHFWGRRCYGLTGRGFAALATMPSLRGLSVSCRNVDDRGLAALPSFPALREFMPMDVPDDGFRHVGACEDLETLHCMYCPGMSDAATAHLASLRGLKAYQVWSASITDRSLAVLGGLPSLEHLLFNKCSDVTDAGVAAVARLPRLDQVDFENMAGVTPEGAAVFPPRVRVNYTR